MNRRKMLWSLMVGVITLGVTLSFVPFISSLGPNARGDAALPRIDVSGLAPGSLGLVEDPVWGDMWSGHKVSLLFYRSLSGEVRAWRVPTRNGHIGMPDLRWWRPFYDCKNFGPTIVNGKVSEELPMKCHDESLPSEWWAEQWQWSVEGKNLGSQVSDMDIAKGTFEGKYFVYAKTNSQQLSARLGENDSKLPGE